MNVEKKIRRLMEIQKGSVKQFAEEIEVPYTTVRSILDRGILNAKVENVIRIAEGLGVKAEELLDLDISQSILEVYNQLESDRQDKVYKFAEYQLEKQNEVIDSDDFVYETLLGRVSAGTGEYLHDDITEQVRIPRDIIPETKYDLVLRINGISMEPTFEDGEYIFVKKEEHLRSGQIAVFIIDGESYLKKAYIEHNQLRLVSLNTDYEDLTFNSFNDVTLVGTVIL